ncbi:MAG: hypothetical protein QOF11_1313 [Chloroflexota bacterium]|nr:hypothetical protein [Chloroflexota bacterium]
MDLQIAFVATYPPRRCGIATFTRDLARAVGGGRIVAIRDGSEPDIAPVEVVRQVSRDDPADYRRAAREINRSDVEVVSLQHEYGIFGGEDGADVLDLVESLEVPIAATLHTVLRRPSRSQRSVIAALGDRVDKIVVMSRRAAELLDDVYDVDPDKVRVIRHGVPDLPLVDPNEAKPELGLAGREVILSFGLLGPGKGYEQVIEAMARVRAVRPGALFVILGSTHPDLVRREGEAYRDRLREQVDNLDLADHVRFEDRYLTSAELGHWLLAADIFVTPYPGLEQIVSGTLSYALGAGKAIVSTPYAYATELLADGRGMLVPPASPNALADAFVELLERPQLRTSMAERAYAYGRRMIWRRVGESYRDLFQEMGQETGVASAAGRVTSSPERATSRAGEPAVVLARG